MKISYVLLNKTGTDRGIPSGAAWQWIHQVNDEEQMQSVFARLKRKMHEERLTVANLRINQRDCAELFFGVDAGGLQDPIVYDKTIEPKRIIHLDGEADDDALQ